MKDRKNIQKIGTFNCQGLLSTSKQQTLADDFARYNMTVLCVQETHMKDYGALNMKTNDGKNYLLYYSGHKSKSVNGVGIIVDANRKVNFEPISDRICMITITLINNNNNRLIILSVYAPTLEKSEKHPEEADNFYNEMESIIKKVKSRDDLIIAGDFNAITGTAALETNLYKKQIGLYGKGKSK